MSMSLAFSSVKGTEPYKNTSLSFEERTSDLVSKLTLEEKVQLMRYDSPEISRLGIPAHNWWNECLHGVARSGLATVFPQAIGMAAMWDDSMMFNIADAISDEARAKYNDYSHRGKRGIYQGLTFWTPNINIFRDPRWGRGMETYGEDPFLTAGMAIPFIKGLQGNDPKYLKLVATAKHFAVHSGPEATRHSFDVWPNDYDLAETYFPHFKRTVTEAGVYSVMCAYQRFKGIPCCGNQFLENVLRNNWNFKGYIVSDCWAIMDFYDPKAHHITNSPEEAAAMAVKAGTDLNCGVTYANNLLDAVKKGLVSENEINTSVKRLVLARMKLGQFDPESEVPFSKIPLKVVDNEEHRRLALEAARKSIVLLENPNNLLPFTKNVKRVAIIGPNADNHDVLLGNYNGYPSFETTPLKGIKEKLPNADVKYSQGCKLADGLPCLTIIPEKYFFTDNALKKKGLKGEYFDNSDLKGKPKHIRTDANLNFSWWTTPPFPDMKYEHFSVRWKGVLVPPVTGLYALGGEAMNGFRLYIDGKMLTFGKINEHHSRKDYEYVQLEAGKKYNIQAEYVQDNSEYSHIRILWELPNPGLKKEALELAANSDLVVLCMGLSPMLEGEEMKVKVKGFAGGDRLDINLPETQTELIRAIQKIGKPTVLVLLNGSAVAFNPDAENKPAVLDAWYPGQSGGAAVADVIFGDYNPAGRLPVTFYKNISQIPAFEEYDMKGKTYRYFSGKPLYEFGYGLSYTTFEYSVKNIPDEINTGEDIKLSVNVKNTGSMDGDEVVQLYVSLPDSKLKKSIRSLQGFKRIFLKKGEIQTVEFILKPAQFAARNDENKAVVEPGDVLLSIGGKQPDEKSIADKKVISKIVKIRGDNLFIND